MIGSPLCGPMKACRKRVAEFRAICSADEIDAIDLVQEVRQMAQIFRPLMEHVVADAPPSQLQLSRRRARPRLNRRRPKSLASLR